MKLGLLALTVVVVAVVLVSSVSEGRVVSKCELKDKLWERLIVPKEFSSTDKEYLLAVVICELTRISHLNTSMVTVLGERGSGSSSSEMTEETSNTEEMQIEETPSEETTADESSAEEPTAEEPSAEEPSAEEPSVDEPSVDEPSVDEPSVDEPSDEEPSDQKVPAEDAKTTGATTTKAMTSETTTTEPAKTKLVQKAGKKRSKRMVEIFNEEHVWTAYEWKIEQMVNSLKSNCDEEEIMEAEFMTDNEDSDSDAEGDEENQKPWSLGSYGIFQLSDGYFCNSGHRSSKNKCEKSCSAFTDDDITDDIDCFVKSGCWKKTFQEKEFQCTGVKNYFDECK